MKRSVFSVLALVLAMGVATTLASGYGSSGYSSYGGGYGMYGGGYSSGYGSYGGGYGSYGGGYGSYGGGYGSGGYGSGYGSGSYGSGYGKSGKHSSTAMYIPYAVPVSVEQPIAPTPINPLLFTDIDSTQNNGIFGGNGAGLLCKSIYNLLNYPIPSN